MVAVGTTPNYFPATWRWQWESDPIPNGMGILAREIPNGLEFPIVLSKSLERTITYSFFRAVLGCSEKKSRRFAEE